jgi:hypothetical protein
MYSMDDSGLSTRELVHLIELAADEANRCGHGNVGLGHLILAFLRDADGAASRALRALGVDLESARASVVAHVQDAGPSGTVVKVDAAARTAVEDAVAIAQGRGTRSAASTDLLASLLRSRDNVVLAVFADTGVAASRLEELAAPEDPIVPLDPDAGRPLSSVDPFPPVHDRQAGLVMDSYRGPQLRVLRNVLPIAQEHRWDNFELTLRALELYDDGFVVTFRLLTLDGRDPRGTPVIRITAVDDAGRQYTKRGGGGSSTISTWQWRGCAHFFPALHAGVQQLRLRAEGLQWHPRLDAPSPEPRRVVTAGWTFAVDLPKDRG